MTQEVNSQVSSASVASSELRVLGVAEERSGVRGVLYADIHAVNDVDASEALSFQWLANGSSILDATEQRLDVGDFIDSVENAAISVQLSYTNTSGEIVSIKSAEIPYQGFRVVANAEEGRNEWLDATSSEYVQDAVNPYPLVENYSNNGTSSTDGAVSGSAHNITSVRAADEGITAREGDYVIRIYADGSQSNRSELAHLNNETTFKPGEDYYFSGSFFASRAEWDPVTEGGSTVITQLKQYGGGHPNFELRLSNNGDYAMTWRAVRHGLTEYQEMGVALPDQWNDLKIYTKHTQDEDGIFQVWLNGEQVVNYSGPTMYRDAEGYLKFGMYTEIHDERVIYWDAIDISDHISTDFATWASLGEHRPTLSLNEDLDGQQFESSGTLLISGNAADPAGEQLGTQGGIQTIELFLDDTSLAISSEAQFSFSGLNLSPGSNDLRLLATDTDGNTVEESFSVWIGNRPSEVSIDVNEYMLSAVELGDFVALSATASDPDGQVVSVEYLIDGQLVGSGQEASPGQYVLSWTPAENGAYSIQARATDNEGGTTLSASKAILVGVSTTSNTVRATQDVTIEMDTELTGNWSETEVYGSTSSPKIALVEFDLSSISDARYIESATFQPYVTQIRNGAGSFSIYQVGTKAWSQDSVNWQTRPEKGQLLDTITISAEGFVDFDVTEALRDALAAGNSKVSLWIEDSEQEQEGFEFASENNSLDEPAQLLLVSATEVVPEPISGSYDISSSDSQSTLYDVDVFDGQSNSITAGSFSVSFGNTELAAELSSAGLSFDTTQIGVGQTFRIESDVDAGDAIGISDVIGQLRHIVGLSELDGLAETNADVDGNGSVGISDVISNLRVIVGLEDAPTARLVDAEGQIDLTTDDLDGSLYLSVAGDVDLSFGGNDLV